MLINNRSDERENGMNKISPEEIKKIMFEVLVVIDEFCRKNSLTYYLCGGTLIGAIRHNGFIPWDDDIDIAMPRKDYEIFLEKFNSYYEMYKVIHCNNDSTYPFPFAKVSDIRTRYIEQCDFVYNGGVYVDIFPIDDFESINEAQKAYKKCYFYKQAIFIKARKAYQKNIIKKSIWTITKLLLIPISANFLARNMENIMQKHSQKIRSNIAYSGCIIWGYGQKEIVNANIFSGILEHKFQSGDFYIPIGYDELLRNIYGDYMQLPPKEQQIPHHSTEAYYL